MFYPYTRILHIPKYLIYEFKTNKVKIKINSPIVKQSHVSLIKQIEIIKVYYLWIQ